jgi:hypothetical protein
MQMFSINAASLLLERDRRTVTKAMFGVTPDGKEKKQARWKMSTIVDALERHGGSNCQSNGNVGCNRLGDIGDELKQLHEELDATIKLVRSLPTMAAKQPHSRAGMQLIQRIDALYNEANVILEAEDSTSLSPYVAPQIVGTCFRLLLAAAYGPKMDIDGVRIFTDAQIKQFGLAA